GRGAGRGGRGRGGWAVALRCGRDTRSRRYFIGRTLVSPTHKLRPLQQEITDLPNLVTLVRIGFIPLVLIWIDNDNPRASALSCLIFFVAAVSDALDGYLARRMGLVTVVGKFLDPLADKLIVLSTLVALTSAGRAPAW